MDEECEWASTKDEVDFELDLLTYGYAYYAVRDGKKCYINPKDMNYATEKATLVEYSVVIDNDK